MMPTVTRDDWGQRYVNGDTPWDVGRPCEELAALVADGRLQPTRTLELGCGSGTNAIFLAEKGFQVTAVDLSLTAVVQAQNRAAERGVSVDFVCGDLLHFPEIEVPFRFVFDLGCYHAVRRVDCAGYLAAVRRATCPGSRALVVAGNATEQLPPGAEGPPRVTEQELRDELGTLFNIEELKVFRLVMRDGQPGPLFWSAWMIRP